MSFGAAVGVPGLRPADVAVFTTAHNARSGCIYVVSAMDVCMGVCRPFCPPPCPPVAAGWSVCRMRRRGASPPSSAAVWQCCKQSQCPPLPLQGSVGVWRHRVQRQLTAPCGFTARTLPMCTAVISLRLPPLRRDDRGIVWVQTSAQFLFHRSQCLSRNVLKSAVSVCRHFPSFTINCPPPPCVWHSV